MRDATSWAFYHLDKVPAIQVKAAELRITRSSRYQDNPQGFQDLLLEMRKQKLHPFGPGDYLDGFFNYLQGTSDEKGNA